MKKKRGKKFKVIVCVGAVLVLAGGILAGRHFLQAKKASSEGVTGQSTTTLTKMDLTDSISASGTIESRKTQTVVIWAAKAASAADREVENKWKSDKRIPL